VAQHPRVVRRLLPGSCAAAARPRRLLPCHQAAAASVAGQQPPCRGGSRPAFWRQPPGRPAAAARWLAAAVAAAASISLFAVTQINWLRCRRVAGLTRDAAALLAFVMTEALGSRPGPCARNTIREAISRDTSSSQHISMQDTLSEGTARAAQLQCTKLRSKAPVAVTNVCLPVAIEVAMGNPLATHTEASTKLITAHQAHHCDDHVRSQSRGIIIDSRSSVCVFYYNYRTKT